MICTCCEARGIGQGLCDACHLAGCTPGGRCAADRYRSTSAPLDPEAIEAMVRASCEAAGIEYVRHEYDPTTREMTIEGIFPDSGGR